MDKKITELTDLELAQASNQIWSQMTQLQSQLQLISNEISQRGKEKKKETEK